MSLNGRIFRRVSWGSAVMVVLMTLFVTRIYQPARWKTYFAYSNDVSPITFYGIVTDQRGGPVAGAEVSAVVSSVNPFYLAGAAKILRETPFDVVTDAQGRFQIGPARGRHLRITSISKDGYMTIPGEDAYASNVPGHPPPWLFDYMPSTSPPYRYVSDPRFPATFPLAKPKELPTTRPERGGVAPMPPG